MCRCVVHGSITSLIYVPCQFLFYLSLLPALITQCQPNMGTLNTVLQFLCSMLLIYGSYGVNLGEKVPVICSSPNVGCDYDETNLISTVFQVPSLAECRQLCLDEDDCEFITYFNASAFPIPKECRLYRSCDTVNECSNCVSENVDCFQTCGSPLVGLIDDNFITASPNVTIAWTTVATTTEGAPGLGIGGATRESFSWRWSLASQMFTFV